MPYRSLYNPTSKDSYKLSRSALNPLSNVPATFAWIKSWELNNLPAPPFTLNSAVDHLLKQEFDIHRAKGQAHPLMKEYGIAAIPYSHPDLDKWRENFRGVQYLHKKTKS